MVLGNDTTGHGSSLCATLRIDFLGVSQLCSDLLSREVHVLQ